MKYRVHCLMNYEHNSFGMDLVFAITSKEEPLASGIRPAARVNEAFIEALNAKEQQGNYFLSSYYGVSLNSNSMNMDKVCRIKELSELEEEEEDEPIIVKKYEEF